MSDVSPGSGHPAGRPAATAPPRRSAGNPTARSQHRAAWTLLAPFLIIFALTFVAPIVYAFGLSFTRVQRIGLFGEGGTSSGFAGLENYRLALADTGFTDSIVRMFLFGAIQVPVMIALATILALLLESASARWPMFFRATYFMPYGVPGVIATILWSFLYVPGLSPVVDAAAAVGVKVDFLGGDSVLWSIANIVTWTYAGYNMLIIVAQLKAIPAEVYEAARVDGAGALRRAFSVQLPLIAPAVLLTVVFSIIGTLQLFAEPQILATVAPSIDSSYTPNLAAYTNAFVYNDYGVASAQAVIIAVVAFVLSFTLLRLTNRKDAS